MAGLLPVALSCPPWGRSRVVDRARVNGLRRSGKGWRWRSRTRARPWMLRDIRGQGEQCDQEMLV